MQSKADCPRLLENCHDSDKPFAAVSAVHNSSSTYEINGSLPLAASSSEASTAGGVEPGHCLDQESQHSAEGDQPVGQTHQPACESDTQPATATSESKHAAADISWSQAYHLQTFALRFNGLNDYVRLPAISLVDKQAARQGLTLEITFMCSPDDHWGEWHTLAGLPPGVVVHGCSGAAMDIHDGLQSPGHMLNFHIRSLHDRNPLFML